MGENTAADPGLVKFIDVSAIRFGGMPIGFNPRKLRDKGPVATPALKALGVDLEIDLPAKAIEVTHFAHVGPLAVDLPAPGLATLVGGAFRSTARAHGPGRLTEAKMKNRVEAMLLHFLNPIPCNSDFFELS